MNKNLEKAKQLEAEAKELRRAEKKFWDEVSDRQDEILEFFSKKNVGQKFEKMSDNKLDEAASFYGITADELFDYIISERQINYYKNTHKLEG